MFNNIWHARGKLWLHAIYSLSTPFLYYFKDTMSAKKASQAGVIESKKYELSENVQATSAAALMTAIQKSFPQFVKVKIVQAYWSTYLM